MVERFGARTITNQLANLHAAHRAAVRASYCRADLARRVPSSERLSRTLVRLCIAPEHPRLRLDQDRGEGNRARFGP
jgi:hypothetical protein